MAGKEVLDTISLIRATYLDVHCICGLSNVSYGLPQRNILIMVQTMVQGMDAYILDPTGKELLKLYYAGKALLGKDKYCSDYIKAYRRGLLDSAKSPKEGVS